MENEITEVTRRAIIDHFTINSIAWWGRLTEDEFLARLYDLTKIPSTDGRFRNAAGDIRQHRLNWLDWPDDWVFYDQRFNLLRALDEEFLRFLCETVHPVVRPDSDEAVALVGFFNQHLNRDGWEIFRKGDLSGRPVFAARKVGQRPYILEEPTGWEKVDRQIQEIRLRLEMAATEEQFQTVGLLCREVLISLAETVYDQNRHQPIDGILPSRTNAVRMLEAFFAAELGGESNEEMRSYVKAALRLANALQHKRTADSRLAVLCAEATLSVVNAAAVLAGRRG